MVDIKGLFNGRKAIKKALEGFGFEKFDDGYVYTENILDGQFFIKVTVKGDALDAEVFDGDTGDRYYLFAVEGAEGAFVGEVRSEYERVINLISEKCFSNAEIYRESTAKAVIKYAEKKYRTPQEFLWHDENAVMRRKDNRKWYALFMVVRREKLGLDGEGVIEIIDLRAPAGEIARITDGNNYLPAYHMNKKSWITIPLDGRVNAEIICALVDISYELAKGKK